ncbi:UNVERIFIED_CONTAM: hypothetical protein K2H54_056777 [Gekko kuhli]
MVQCLGHLPLLFRIQYLNSCHQAPFSPCESVTVSSACQLNIDRAAFRQPSLSSAGSLPTPPHFKQTLTLFFLLYVTKEDRLFLFKVKCLYSPPTRGHLSPWDSVQQGLS